MGCVFLALAFYVHIGTYINRGNVDCNDVTICYPLRIGSTYVSNHLGHTYPIRVHLHTNQPTPASPHSGNLITVKHILAECTFHNRLRWKLQFPKSYKDIFLPTHMDKILKFIASNSSPEHLIVPPAKSPTMAHKLGE